MILLHSEIVTAHHIFFQVLFYCYLKGGFTEKRNREKRESERERESSSTGIFPMAAKAGAGLIESHEPGVSSRFSHKGLNHYLLLSRLKAESWRS